MAAVAHKRKEENTEESNPKRFRIFSEKNVFVSEIQTQYQYLIQATKNGECGKYIPDIIRKVKESPMKPIQACQQGGISRAFQACLKHGNKEQREEILDYIQEIIPDLIIDKAGGPLMEKVLKYVPKIDYEEKDITEKKIEGKTGRPELHISKDEKLYQEKLIKKILEPLLNLGETKLNKIFFTKFGCKCFNSLLTSTFMKNQYKNKLINLISVPKKISLLYENYNDNLNLKQFIDNCKDKEILKQLNIHLLSCLEKAIDKELLNFNIVHQLLNNFLLTSDENQIKNFVDNQLPIEGCVHLIQTKQGCDSLTKLYGYFSSKQKKTLIKLLKGKFFVMATNNVCYLLICKLLICTDDTVLLSKTILSELEEGGVKNLLEDNYGKRVLYLLYDLPNTKVYNPYEIEHLLYNSPTALKDNEKRKDELKKFFLTKIKFENILESIQKPIEKDIVISLLDDFTKEQIIKELGLLMEDDLIILFKKNTFISNMITILRLNNDLSKKLYNFFTKDIIKSILLTRGISLVLECWKNDKENIEKELKKYEIELVNIIEKAEKENPEDKFIGKAAKILFLEVYNRK